MMRLMFDDQYKTMPWDKIDAVVFDIGNVLLDYNPDRILRDRVPEREDLHEKLKAKIMRSPYWIMLDRGIMTREEAIVAMTGWDKELEPYIRRVLARPIELDDVLEEGVAAMRRCKEMGKKIFVLSNFHVDAYEYIVGRHEFFSLLDGEVVSGRVHMVKPDREIFAHLTEKFSLDSSRTLFVDDSPANIETALEMGWQGLCYSKNGQLDKFFSTF